MKTVEGGRISRNVVRGAPVDPALGLPRYVIYERRWVQWTELFLGVGMYLFGLGALIVLVRGGNLDGKYGALILIAIPIGPVIVWEAWSKIRRWSCLVIAERGFDDRMGDDPAGPVLWSEVESMGSGSHLHVGTHGSMRVPTYLVKLRGGARGPLSPLGAAPKQVGQVVLQIGFRGEETLIPGLMDEAFRQWQETGDAHAGYERT